MRSTLKTITLAAFALSVAAGGAFAASGPAPAQADSGLAIYGEHLGHTPPMATPGAMKMTPHQTHLAQVLAELRSTDQTIRHDEAMHRLSVASARKLEGEAGSIRHRAVVVADAHKGAIPNATFQHLKADIRELDRDIVQMS